VLLLVLVSSFIAILFWVKSRYFEKIIWGLSILIFALTQKNDLLSWVAIFIGGLLIATETFLLYLASIFRAWENTVDKLMEHYNANLWLSKPSEAEKKQKIEEEVTGVLISGKTNEDRAKQHRDRISELRNSEKALSEYFSNVFETRFKNLRNIVFTSEMKASTDRGSHIFDWLVFLSNSEKVFFWIEYKNITTSSTMSSRTFIEMRIREFIGRIFFYKFPFPVIFVLVSQWMSNDDEKTLIDKFENEDLKIVVVNFDPKNGVSPVSAHFDEVVWKIMDSNHWKFRF
jgi:hypothetical protein